MNKYDQTTRIISNTIHDPFFTKNPLDEGTKGNSYHYNTLGFGNKCYYDTYIITRNILYLVSHFESLGESNPLLEAMKFIGKSYGFTMKFTACITPKCGDFQLAKEKVANEVHGLMILYTDRLISQHEPDREEIIQSRANLVKKNILSYNTWEGIIRYLSSHWSKELHLHNVCSILRNGFFVDYQFETNDSFFKRELESAITISLFKLTNNVSNINVFKNEQ